MQPGNPISTLWFVFVIAIALVVSSIIYQCSGNIPYQP